MINRVTLVILSEAKNLSRIRILVEILRFAQNDMANGDLGLLLPD